MKPTLIVILLTFFKLTTLAQPKSDVEALLSDLSGQSEDISKDSAVKNLIYSDEKVLLPLSALFADNTASKVFSKCSGRYITRGELAIIADHIEAMPYFTLTGLENCMLQSCNSNPNFVAYYLNFIKFNGMTATFKRRYDEWLKSPERKKFLNNKLQG